METVVVMLSARPVLILVCGLPGSGKTTSAVEGAWGTVPVTPGMLAEYAEHFGAPDDDELNLFDRPAPARAT
ncbi:hypothetical protein [Streptomyces sp. NBC_01506]|uniref:hypothetical protein n=1 Tax=Streptomyces sp. NBC_01506 TaxID=2903887 RepID=UPI00386EF805